MLLRLAVNAAYCVCFFEEVKNSLISSHCPLYSSLSFPSFRFNLAFSPQISFAFCFSSLIKYLNFVNRREMQYFSSENATQKCNDVVKSNNRTEATEIWLKKRDNRLHLKSLAVAINIHQTVITIKFQQAKKKLFLETLYERNETCIFTQLKPVTIWSSREISLRVLFYIRFRLSFAERLRKHHVAQEFCSQINRFCCCVWFSSWAHFINSYCASLEASLKHETTEHPIRKRVSRFCVRSNYCFYFASVIYSCKQWCWMPSSIIQSQ